MDRTDLADLFDYDRWATQRLLDAAAGIDSDAYARNLGFGFGGLRGTLVHLYASQRLWLSRWKGNSPKTSIGEDQVPTLDALREQWEAYRIELEDFMRFLSDDNMREKFSYLDTHGNFQEQPLYQQMLHVIHHATYHRGQAAAILRLLGVAPPNTDLRTFLQGQQ
jgi:uncharacterized damage-inducible protein DinB